MKPLGSAAAVKQPTPACRTPKVSKSPCKVTLTTTFYKGTCKVFAISQFIDYCLGPQAPQTPKVNKHIRIFTFKVPNAILPSPQRGHPPCRPLTLGCRPGQQNPWKSDVNPLVAAFRPHLAPDMHTLVPNVPKWVANGAKMMLQNPPDLTR